MRVLLVESKYRKGTPRSKEKRDDNTLWYPPLGLLKLGRFHKERGDEVRFVSGFDKNLFARKDLFSEGVYWDRIYITTLFTYHFDSIVKTINSYKDAVGGTASNIFVGGIMASIMPDDIWEETGIHPVTGILNSPRDIRLTSEENTSGDTNIDLLPPDYSLLEDYPHYAINDTFYAYTSRGCTNKCPWCGVPKIEPEYVPYIDIKSMIKRMRDEYGDKPILKLMDNNVLASAQLEQIAEDLLELGYGRKKLTTDKRQRVVDFNQGLDATHLSEGRMKLLSRLHIKPIRIAFDRVAEKKIYLRAMKTALKHGAREFSNYMLYNWNDTPRDLYERLSINIKLNEQWRENGTDSHVYCYPMRFAPIDCLGEERANRSRDYVPPLPSRPYHLINAAKWTRKFIRNIEIMKGAAHGAISPTPSLAWRTIGKKFEIFVANLYMPEELIRNRNKHEKKVSKDEPKRPPGTGKIEEFRRFIAKYIEKPTNEFWNFHEAVSENRTKAIRQYQSTCKNKEISGWLKWYLRNEK